jgi:hypothetical protein
MNLGYYNGSMQLKPAVGLEPTTGGLRNRCSAAELRWQTLQVRNYTMSLNKSPILQTSYEPLCDMGQHQTLQNGDLGEHFI